MYVGLGFFDEAVEIIHGTISKEIATWIFCCPKTYRKECSHEK